MPANEPPILDLRPDQVWVVRKPTRTLASSSFGDRSRGDGRFGDRRRPAREIDERLAGLVVDLRV